MKTRLKLIKNVQYNSLEQSDKREDLKQSRLNPSQQRSHLHLVKTEDCSQLKQKEDKSDKKYKDRRGLARTIRYYWLKLLRLQGDPKFLARGVAIGVFICLTPTIPLHTTLTLLFCAMLSASPVAGVIATWIISNPLTIPLQYYLAWRIGTWVTGNKLSWEHVQLMLHNLEKAGFIHGAEMMLKTSMDLIWTMLVGGVILALPIAIISYFLALKAYRHVRQKKQQKTA